MEYGVIGKITRNHNGTYFNWFHENVKCHKSLDISLASQNKIIKYSWKCKIVLTFHHSFVISGAHPQLKTHNPIPNNAAQTINPFWLLKSSFFSQMDRLTLYFQTEVLGQVRNKVWTIFKIRIEFCSKLRRNAASLDGDNVKSLGMTSGLVLKCIPTKTNWIFVFHLSTLLSLLCLCYIKIKATIKRTLGLVRAFVVIVKSSRTFVWSSNIQGAAEHDQLLPDVAGAGWPPGLHRGHALRSRHLHRR